MGADLEQWKHCLVKSIQLFCRNFCQYDQEAKIDGLLAITLDQKEVILVKLQEVDNDASPDRSASGPASDQSEMLESILRYLAPSCRLLKKTAIAPTLPSVWQPVSDGTGSAEIPDRLTFLQSLGLAPTALVSNRKVETSYASRLRTRSSRRMMRSIPPFSFCPLPVSVSPRICESSRDVHSEPPTLSPCPSREVPSVSKSDGSEPSDDCSPLPQLKRCVSDDEKKESVKKSSPKSEDIQTAQPLTIDCNKDSSDFNGVSHHSRLLNTKSASLLQMVKCTGCADRDSTSSSKKSPNCTCRDTDSLFDDAHNGKPLNRPKKRSHGNMGSSAPAVENRSKSSTSTHSAAVKRVKVEASESATNLKLEDGTSETSVKGDVSRTGKKIGQG